jgi:integrase
MLKTRSGLPKYCCWAIDRHGKRRVRFRKNGLTTYIAGIPWSEDFMRAYATALEAAMPCSNGNIGAGRTLPGSLNALVTSYYKSPEFRGLKASSQKVRRQVIEKFRGERAPSGQLYGDKPIKGLARVHIKEIIGGRAATPEAANSLLKALRILLDFAVDAGMIPTNPALGVKRYKSRGEGFHCWTEDEITVFRGAYPIGTRERLVFSLCLFTGQRISDVVTMGWQNITKDKKGRDWIAVRQIKTGTSLSVCMHPELAEVLAAVPRTNLTILTDETGAPFVASKIGAWFAERCDGVGLPQCTAHGLRKAAATRLADAGCSTEMIKAITGHRSARQVEEYIRTVNQRRLAEQALAMQLQAEENIRALNLVQPETRLVQPGD